MSFNAMSFDRRKFLQSALPVGATAAGLMGSWNTPWAQAPNQAAGSPPARGLSQEWGAITEKTVALNGDSPPTTHEAEIAKLQTLMARAPYADTYLKGGAVTDFEIRMAALLGKESAAFFPTGTMANNIAVRLLCGDRRNLLIQHEAHLYQDEGEGPSILSGLNMIPVGGVGNACPGPDAWAEAIAIGAKSAYYATRIGAASIESPIRRANGECVPFDKAANITSMLRSKGIAVHLDGSRLFLMSGTPGFEVKAYCALFDTVFVSIYKFFGAPFGAILAGKKDLIDQAKEIRHTMGGLIYHGWMAAIPALAACDGFEARFTQVHTAAQKLLDGLQAAGGFDIQRIDNGTNIAFAMVSPDRQKGLMDRLAKADIRVAPLVDGKMKLWWNESLTRQPTAEILKAFVG